MLRSDGSGFVEKCSPIPHRTAAKEVPVLQEFLSGRGYMPDEKVFLQAAIAKFFYTNSLGPLTVYPACSCFMESYDVFAEALASNAWKTYQEEVAFLMPLRTGTCSPSRLHEFGTVVGWKASRAGGPFVLTQTADLVAEALQRLGFVDAEFNADLLESMLVFANTGLNKRLLRKTGQLPEKGDSAKKITEKFKRAFLSSCTSGQWQLAPSDTQLRRLLVSKKYIANTDAPKAEVFESMRQYTKKLALPARRTYNGLAWQLLARINQKDPARRPAILM